jgi:hypothetical protein
MFSQTPRFVFDMSDTELEHAHFSTWWGGFAKRNYESDTTHDLYALHELAHACYLTYHPNTPFNVFCAKLLSNEMLAATISEMEVYFKLSIRDVSFPYPILVDKVLKDPYFLNLHNHCLRSELIGMRTLWYETPHGPTSQDVNWLKRFHTQNKAWCDIWHDRYSYVETAMYALQHRADKKAALENHVATLMLTGEDNIPFYREACEFSKVFWQLQKSVPPS